MSNRTEPGQAASTHALIAGYHANRAQRLSFVRDMFNRTARHYDAANRLFSLGSGALYRRVCLRWAGLTPGMRVLDIAVGTGLLAREMLALTRDPAAITGIDVSAAMLAIARAKLPIPLIEAAAESLPLRADSFDLAAMGYALRHIADITSTLREALRVLRPGGTILLLEISAPRKKLNRALAAFYIGRLIPLLSLVTTRSPRARTLMRYHWDTIVSYMPPESVLAALRDAGFERVEVWTELDLFHCFKARKPVSQPHPASGALPFAD